MEELLMWSYLQLTKTQRIWCFFPRDSFVSNASQRDLSCFSEAFRPKDTPWTKSSWSLEWRDACHLNAPWWDKSRGREVDFCREGAATSPPSNILRFAKEKSEVRELLATQIRPPPKKWYDMYDVSFLWKGFFAATKNDASMFRYLYPNSFSTLKVDLVVKTKASASDVISEFRVSKQRPHRFRSAHLRYLGNDPSTMAHTSEKFGTFNRCSQALVVSNILYVF